MDCRRQGKSRTRRTKALAESFLSDLRQAAKRGEAFDVATGLPESMMEAKQATSWLAFVIAYLDAKWPHAAAKSRDGLTDSLATVTPALVCRSPRTAGQGHAVARPEALLPLACDRTKERPAEIAAALRWLEDASLPVKALQEARPSGRGLDAIALKLDGKPAAAATVARKRAIFYNALQYAVELEELDSNPIDRVRWKPIKVAESVDPRVVINPRQAAELLAAVTYIGSRGKGRRLMALYACMYYAALRPGEAVALRKNDCHLPESGWGKLTLSGSRPEVNTRWTDSGSAHEQRQLKHRARQDVRVVPIPPKLVAILQAHIKEFGTAETAGCSAANEAKSSPRPRTGRCGRTRACTGSHLNEWPRPSHAVHTTCGTPRSRCGSTPEFRPPRSPEEPATAWTSCSRSTPSASRVRRRWLTAESTTL